MLWIAPSEIDTNTAALEKRLWDAADHFRTNSGLKSQEYSAPVLGLIFLRFAEVRFAAKRAQLESPSPLGAGERRVGGSGLQPAGPFPSPGAPRVSRRGSRVDEPAAYHAEGILYLPAEARFDYTICASQLHRIQPWNDALARRKWYYLLNRPEAENIGAKVNAAMRDVGTCERRSPKCEVQSVRQSKLVNRDFQRLSIHGVEKTDETGRLCRLNLAVHGLEGDIRHGGNINSYYDDPHDATGRFPFGLPRTDNANCQLPLAFRVIVAKGSLPSFTN